MKDARSWGTCPLPPRPRRRTKNTGAAAKDMGKHLKCGQKTPAIVAVQALGRFEVLRQVAFRRRNNHGGERRHHVAGKEQAVVRLIKGQMTGSLARRVNGFQMLGALSLRRRAEIQTLAV